VVNIEDVRVGQILKSSTGKVVRVTGLPPHAFNFGCFAGEVVVGGLSIPLATKYISDGWMAVCFRPFSVRVR
jgi:hypothetical protein